MECLNKVEIRGIVGNVRIYPATSENPKRTCRFSVVTNYAYKTKTNDIIESCWFNVNAWPGKYINDPDFDKITKGSKIQVTGRLREDNYTDKDGVPHFSYQIFANSINLISGEETMVAEMA